MGITRLCSPNSRNTVGMHSLVKLTCFDWAAAALLAQQLEAARLAVGSEDRAALQNSRLAG